MLVDVYGGVGHERRVGGWEAGRVISALSTVHTHRSNEVSSGLTGQLVNWSTGAGQSIEATQRTAGRQVNRLQPAWKCERLEALPVTQCKQTR